MRSSSKRTYARKQGGRVLHEILGKSYGGLLARCGVIHPAKLWTRPRRGLPRRALCKNCARAASPRKSPRRGWRGGRKP